MANMAALSNTENMIPDCSNSGNKTTLASCCSDTLICICVLSGLPGSGKTTLLRNLLDSSNEHSEIARQFTELIIFGIEYDAMVPVPPVDRLGYLCQEEHVSGKWKSDRSQIVSATDVLLQHICHNSLSEISLQTKPTELMLDVWQQFLHIIELFNAKRQKIGNQVVLMVDDNMYFRSMRYEYYKLAKKYRTGYCQIYLQCPCEKALERNKNRKGIHQVPDEVIVRMSEKFEAPDPEKHHWESNSITVSAEENINIEQILIMIQKAMLDPVQCPEEADTEDILKSRIECSSSLLHQADLILRKCVATKMAEFKACIQPEKLKEKSQHVLKTKEQVMYKLKEGYIPLKLSKELDITDASQNPDSELFKFIENIFLEELSKS